MEAGRWRRGDGGVAMEAWRWRPGVPARLTYLLQVYRSRICGDVNLSAIIRPR